MKTRFLLAALMISVTACAYSVKGEAANASTNSQVLSNFYGLVINTPANVILEQGIQPSIRFEGSAKDLNLISSKIENGNLTISGSNLNSPTIYITFSELNLIELNSNARLYSSQVINSDLLLLKVNGSGTIRLDIRSLSLGMIVKGSGKIFASGSTGTSFVRIYGEGKVYTTNLDSFSSEEEINTGKQAYRSSILRSDPVVFPIYQHN